MKKFKELWGLRNKYVYLLLFSSVVLMIGAVIYYSYLNDSIIEAAENGIREYSESRSELIQNWGTERLADANIILHNYIFLSAVGKNKNNQLLINNPESFNEWLEVFRRSYNYSAVVFVDDSFKITEIGANDSTFHPVFNLAEELQENQDQHIRFSKVYECETCNKLHLFIIIPYRFVREEEPVGYFILQTNPEESLIPVFELTHKKHKSNDVLFLQEIDNKWHYIESAKSPDNHPVLAGSGKDEIGKQMAEGKFGLTWGKDFRDVEVLGYSRKIPDSKFAIIAKVDKSEIMDELNFAGIAIGVLLIFSFIGTAGLFYLLHKNKESELIKKELENTQLKNQLQNRIDHILENANDIIISVSTDGKILKVNKKALSTYGYTREEMLAMNITDLRAFSNLAEFTQSLSEIKEKGGLIFESTHKRKDGSKVPVEISAKFIELDNETGIYKSIVRDITERKEMEAHNNRLKRLYSTLSAVNQTIVRINSEEILYKQVCDILIAEGGFNHAWVGVKERKSNKIKALAYSGDANQIDKNIKITYTEDEYGSGPSGKALREKRSIAINNFKTEANLASWNNLIDEYDINSGASVPIFRNNEIFGVFTVYSTEKEAFLKEETDLLDEIGSDISYALDQIDKERIRVKIEKEIEESEKRYRIMMEASNDIIWSVNKEGYITEISPASEKLFRKKPEELIGTKFSDLIPTDKNENAQSIFENQLKEGKIVTESHSVVKGENSNLIYLRSNIYPIKNENGEVTGFWGASKDITDETAAFQKLTESEEKFRRIAENAEDIIFRYRIKPELELEYVNQAIEKITGFSPEESFKNSKILLELAHPEDKEIIFQLLTGNNESNKAIIRAYHKNNNLIYIQFILVKIYDSNNEVKAIEGIARDVTEQMKYEDKLKTAKEHAEEMNRLKSTFLANMSHELRTPMVGILGYSEILNDMTSDEEMKEMTQLLLKSGQRLNETLNSILDLSKIETDSLKVKLTPCNLNSIISESHKLFSPVAKNCNLTLGMELKSGHNFVNADPHLLLKALNNLVSNAIKYTKSGGIIIKTADSNKNIRITVSDTGIGIPEEKLDMIFEPFRQVSEGFTRSFEGSGLGLTVTRKYIELMNGKFLVESREGEGSSFIIELQVSDKKTDMGSEQKTEVKTEHLSRTNQLRILHMEDDETSAKVINSILSPVYDIDQAATGEDGILLAVTNDYDLILMDISLRGKYDGLDTIAELRKLDRYKDVPIIALTAHAMAGDREKFLNDGCDDYLSKPFKRKDLLNIIGRNIRSESA